MMLQAILEAAEGGLVSVAEALTRLAAWFDTPIAPPWVMATLDLVVWVTVLVTLEVARAKGRRVWVGLALYAVFIFCEGLVAATPPPGPSLTPLSLLWVCANLLIFGSIMHRNRRPAARPRADVGG